MSAQNGATKDSALSETLTAVVNFLTTYVAFPSEHEPIAIALWTVHTRMVETFETSPILAVTSAEMRSGKTLVLDCLELLVSHPFRVITPSEAVVYTVLATPPTGHAAGRGGRHLRATYCGTIRRAARDPQRGESARHPGTAGQAGGASTRG